MNLLKAILPYFSAFSITPFYMYTGFTKYENRELCFTPSPMLWREWIANKYITCLCIVLLKCGGRKHSSEPKLQCVCLVYKSTTFLTFLGVDWVGTWSRLWYWSRHWCSFISCELSSVSSYLVYIVLGSWI